jgi:RHS repeat-associated protein
MAILLDNPSVPAPTFTAAPNSPSREYLYSGLPAVAGGALLATFDAGGTKYHHPDQLSPRVSTDSNGTKISEQGHFPFGESWYETGTTTKWKFTTYERDAESGNAPFASRKVLRDDYALARSYLNRLARFSSPDPVAGSLADPQSLNRYAYVLNDPINLADPSGLNISCGDTVTCTIDTTPPADTHSGFYRVVDVLWMMYAEFAPGWFAAQGPARVNGNPGDLSKLIGPPKPPPPPPPCDQESLDDPRNFWNDSFATPEDIDRFFQSQNGPGTWDGYNAATAFIAKGINPALAIGIIGAETSFGNNGLSERNKRDPFSAGGTDFASSLTRGLGAIVKLEDHTYTGSRPVSALTNGRNDLPSNMPGSGQLYTTTDRDKYTGFINYWFRAFAKFQRLCR